MPTEDDLYLQQSITYHRGLPVHDAFLDGYYGPDLLAELAAFYAALGLTGDIADLGCGNGRRSTRILADCAPDVNVIGYDSSPDLVDAVRALNLPNVKAELANVTSANWNPQTDQWDHVALWSLASHMTADRVCSLLERVAPALRPGGSVSIFDQGPGEARRLGERIWRVTLDDGTKVNVSERPLGPPRDSSPETAPKGWIIKELRRPGQVTTILTRAHYTVTHVHQLCYPDRDAYAIFAIFRKGA